MKLETTADCLSWAFIKTEIIRNSQVPNVKTDQQFNHNKKYIDFRQKLLFVILFVNYVQLYFLFAVQTKREKGKQTYCTKTDRSQAPQNEPDFIYYICK